MKLKYIIIDKGGLELPIIFNGNILNHNEIYLRNEQIVSAGFCSHFKDGWDCWGKSLSLNKESRPQDNNLLNKFIPIFKS